MSHLEQRNYVESVKSMFPYFFTSSIKVLDVGSLDINGSCKDFFKTDFYIGCDIGKGKRVDIVSPAHELKFVDSFFDCVISCEAFEHDKYLQLTLLNIIRMLRKGGLFVFTCATIGREEHGTDNYSPESSPYTNQYYKNLTTHDFKIIEEYFNPYKFDIYRNDLRFYGIKI